MSLNPALINDLRVVSLRSDDMTSLQSSWRKLKSVIMAESCARQVWVGTEKDFVDFPKTELENILEGRDAYAFLVRLASGLDSPRRGETNVKGEMFKRWDKTKQRRAVVRGIDSIFQSVKADSRIVGKILGQVQSSHNSLVSRDLSGLQGNSVVTMISGLNAHDRVPDNVDRLLRVLNHKNRRPNLVYVTNPDSCVTETVLTKALFMRQRGIIEFDVTSIPFESLPKIVELSNHVFCDIPLGMDNDFDTELFYLWQNRQNRNNSFCHVSGNLKADIGVWQYTAAESYISPLDVAHETHRRIDSNQELFQKAEELVEIIASDRAQGIPVTEVKLKQKVPKLLAA